MMAEPARSIAAQSQGIAHPGPDVSPDALAALIRRPGFDDALMAVAERVVEEYRASWVLNRILSDRGRLVAAFMALDLYFADPARTGFTLEQLRNEAATHGFASRGRITAWAASLRLLGLFAAAPTGRPQRLVPTEKFIAIFRTRMRHIWRSVAIIHPPANLAIAALEQDAFLFNLPAGFMGPYRAGQRVFHGIPELADVADREAGLIVLISIMLKDAAGTPITIASLAREFAISRAHVRSILQAAETLDLVARPQADGAYHAKPGLIEGIRRFFASLFQAHIFAMDRALQYLGRSEHGQPGAQ